MAADDEEKPSATSEGASSPEVHRAPISTGTVVVFSSVFASAILAGFAITMKASRREGELSLPPTAERPSRLAVRALGLGTLGAVLGTGTLCLSLSYALGIKEVCFRC